MMSPLSKRLEEWMRLASLSEADVASRLRCSQGVVRLWLRGLRNPENGKFGDRLVRLLRGESTI